MNIDKFCNQIAAELFYGSLPGWQREPVLRILEEGQRRQRSPEDIAYVLATAYHETERFKWDEEIGRGRGRDYGRSMLLMRGHSVTYHGRGYVQLTWLDNYAKMSVFLTEEHGRPVNLVSDPDLAKRPEFASLIIWEGMTRGMFTGKNLADYINDDARDFVGARRIVNGIDKAELIAGYAHRFLAALEAAQ